MALDNAQLRVVIESILFVAEGTVDLKTLARLTETNAEQVAYCLDELAQENRGRGVRVQRTGDRVQLVSAPEATAYVQRYLGIDENQRLTPAMLATLTVIAYRQPVTRGEVEHILKKNCDYGVMMLKARNLITEVGRADGVGRPYLYGTTFKFLEHFGLERPEDLPPLPELDLAAAGAALGDNGGAEEPPGEEPESDGPGPDEG
jgi:segregation and condensation protein B